MISKDSRFMLHNTYQQCKSMPYHKMLWLNNRTYIIKADMSSLQILEWYIIAVLLYVSDNLVSITSPVTFVLIKINELNFLEYFPH